MYRKQIEKIIEDLNKKIVFIVGPRQVGKTWLSKEIGKRYENTVYLNYDRFEDREIIKKEQWLKTTNLLILDELHKMKNWKNYLKGVFDTKTENLKILVTGSARLETYRRAGDSLAGRFFVHKLLPFSLAELSDQVYQDVDRLIKRGGFPEPFLAKDDVDADRWRAQYIDSMIRTDILDFERIHDFRAIQTVFELLRRSVGSTISYSSIARDVEISPITVKKYIEILEALFIVFRITPHSRNVARSILKGPKIYFYDNGLVLGNDGALFENFVANSLLKHISARNDYFADGLELKYLRTKDGKEVDFCIVNKGNEIVEMIEAKVSDDKISEGLKYFSFRHPVRKIQLIKNLKRERGIDDFEVLEAGDYLKKLFL